LLGRSKRYATPLHTNICTEPIATVKKKPNTNICTEPISTIKKPNTNICTEPISTIKKTPNTSSFQESVCLSSGQLNARCFISQEYLSWRESPHLGAKTLLLARKLCVSNAIHGHLGAIFLTLARKLYV
jgi:hypothetical protein